MENPDTVRSGPFGPALLVLPKGRNAWLASSRLLRRLRLGGFLRLAGAACQRAVQHLHEGAVNVLVVRARDLERPATLKRPRAAQLVERAKLPALPKATP